MARCEARNNTVLILNEWRRDGTLRIPDVQRSLVWTIDQKRLLIDSLLRKYDVPKIYLMEVYEDGKCYYDIYDGQQRLEAIYAFFNDEFHLGNEDAILIDGEKIEISNKTYKQLDNRLRQRLQLQI